ncbi:dystrophin [Platysternon megacephalum]|uniref:Dystrophin n=1 Tax=Platysternon megacephalum TaxID=55544 RepID=A0A4D9EEB0_9SAUR|nr:dystrophin [Platysternon megacephalum]
MASPGGGFCFESCRGILALMDLKSNGRLSLQEFKHLWKLLAKYKDIFRRVEGTGSGFLDVAALRNAVQRAGLAVDDQLLHLTALRYSDSSMRICFPDFVCCMIRLETMASVFRNLSKDGKICFTATETTTKVSVLATTDLWLSKLPVVVTGRYVTVVLQLDKLINIHIQGTKSHQSISLEIKLEKAKGPDPEGKASYQYQGALDQALKRVTKCYLAIRARNEASGLMGSSPGSANQLLNYLMKVLQDMAFPEMLSTHNTS